MTFALLSIAPLPLILADDAFSASLVERLGTAGVVAAVLGTWAVLERRERLSVQKQRDSERAEALPLLTRAVEVLQQVQHGMGLTIERSAPERRDLDALAGQLGRVVDALEDRRGR